MRTILLFLSVFLIVRGTRADSFADTTETVIRLESGELSLELSAAKIHFSSNRVPAEQRGQAGVLPSKCVLDGNARYSLADDDFVITANRIEFRSTQEDVLPSMIVAQGDCEITMQDGAYTWSSDRFVLDHRRAEQQNRITLTGKVNIEYFEGDEKITMSAEKIVSDERKPGKFVPHGNAQIHRERPLPAVAHECPLCKTRFTTGTPTYKCPSCRVLIDLRPQVD